ncbi:hypothetical protein B484DRAFT_391150 [Ochromonadaceae sp. CCMP2298]|nr:hypothetical protein B484DRAFT_391150 [Ochromonadaceae sp. CCMP2298]
MPKLSTSMSAGVLTKLRIEHGQYLESYHHAMDVSALHMLNASSEAQEMEVEVLDDSYVAQLLTREGDTLTPGSPIALLCENEEDLEAAGGVKLPLNYNAYEYEGQGGGEEAKITGPPPIITAMWQAYAKAEVEGCK